MNPSIRFSIFSLPFVFIHIFSDVSLVSCRLGGMSPVLGYWFIYYLL